MGEFAIWPAGTWPIGTMLHWKRDGFLALRPDKSSDFVSLRVAASIFLRNRWSRFVSALPAAPGAGG